MIVKNDNMYFRHKFRVVGEQTALVLMLFLSGRLLQVCSQKGRYPEVAKLIDTRTIFFVIAFDAEFSLARYSDTAVYANNSVIDVNLVGEGFEGLSQITDGGALECHTDDTTCCRGIDFGNPNGTGRGEWYYPDGTVVPPPPEGDVQATGFYRTRDHMVIRLNRVGSTQLPTGVYRCEIPGAGGVNIVRYVTLSIGIGEVQ